MTNQNRLNAGAEYLLYRIWATLQTERGIHVESLLTCVGGLAGYACRRYARQAQTGADELSKALIESPLSVWSLLSRAVLKLEQPLPDIQEIVSRATQAAEVRPGDSPQLPDWHRPQHPALVYLQQLWPQTLPIAQRFCLRPMQMPVLYGIALQRAIEHTKDRLSPTLAASIAMECAIAMSRVDLPEPAPPPAMATAGSASPQPAISAAITAPGLPWMRATPPARKTKVTNEGESATERMLSIVKRVPPAAHIATLACLAFVTTATAMYRGDGGEDQSMDFEAAALVAETQQSSSARPDALSADEQTFPSGDSAEPRAILTAQTSATDEPLPPPVDPSDTPPADSNDMPQQSYYAGNDEGVMRDDYGQPIRMAAEEM